MDHRRWYEVEGTGNAAEIQFLKFLRGRNRVGFAPRAWSGKKFVVLYTSGEGQTTPDALI